MASAASAAAPLAPGPAPQSTDSSLRISPRLGPIDAATKREWEEHNFNITFRDEPFQWYSLLFSFLPWLLFIGFWIFMLRQMQGGPRGLFSFGKSRAKLLRPKMIQQSPHGGRNE